MDTVADSGGLMTRRVGEVVATAFTSFVAQCYRLDGAPPLGSFVRTGSPLVYGVVCRVSTEPLDTSRPVLARGESASSEEEVFRNNLQLARLLTTRFDALIAGHRAGDDCRHFLPPLPPPVHSFVYACSSGEMAQLTNSLEFIRLLLNSGVPVVDEVVGACLRALASELAGDVPRLNSIPSTAS